MRVGTQEYTEMGWDLNNFGGQSSYRVTQTTSYEVDSEDTEVSDK